MKNLSIVKKRIFIFVLCLALIANTMALIHVYADVDSDSPIPYGTSNELPAIDTTLDTHPMQNAPVTSAPAPLGLSVTPFAVSSSFVWFEPGSDNKVNAIVTPPLTQNNWDGTLFFEFHPDTNLNVGDLTFDIDMGSGFNGNVTIENNDVFEITGNAGTIWSFKSKVAMQHDEIATLEIIVSLDGKIRDLPLDSEGVAKFNDIKLSYTTPSKSETLPSLSLEIHTIKDEFSINKEYKNIDAAFPPGLADSNLDQIYTHTFINWEIVTKQIVNTRGVSEYNLTDQVPLASGGKIVSIRRNSEFLYDEKGTMHADLAGSNIATGSIVVSNPTPVANNNNIYSIIVKYPAQIDGTTIANTGNLKGKFSGNASSEVLATKTTDNYVFSSGSGNGLDMSKAISINKQRTFYPAWAWGNYVGEWYSNVLAKEYFETRIGFIINISKQLPGLGTSATLSSNADLVVYDDVITYNGRKLDSSEYYITRLYINPFADATNVKVYLKAAYSDPWPALPQYDGSTNYLITPNDGQYTYVKIVYENTKNVGSADIEIAYKANSNLISEVSSTTEALLANYAGLDMLDSSTKSTALAQPLSGNPIVNINARSGGLLESLDSSTYQSVDGHDIKRAVAFWHVLDWLSFDYDLNAPSINWNSTKERFDITYPHKLYIPGGRGHAIEDFAYVTYLPENIFLDEDIVKSGNSIGSYTGGIFEVQSVETSIVQVSNKPTQKVVVHLKAVGATWNCANSDLNLSLYTEDTELYKSGSTITHKSYIILDGFAHFNPIYVNNATGWFVGRDIAGAGSKVPDETKILHQDKPNENDWMYIKSRADTLPSVSGISFSGVSIDVIDENSQISKIASFDVGSTWKYRIQVASSKGALKDVVVYDLLPSLGDKSLGSTLPRNSDFNVELVDVDLSSISPGKIPTVYYSKNINPSKDLTSSDWTTTKTTDAKALAFDFGSVEFNGTTSPQPDTADIFVTVRSKSDPSLEGLDVYNNVYSKYQIKRGILSFVPVTPRDSRYVKVSLRALGAALGSKVFYDANNNGIMDIGEQGLPNYTVELYNSGQATPVQTTTTDSSGDYLFSISTADTYKVKFTIQSGERFSSILGAVPIGSISTSVDSSTITGSKAYSSSLAISAADIAAKTNFNKLAAGVVKMLNVTYNSNGGTGTVPVDSLSPYLSGSTVTVINEGSLTKAGNSFNGWNTKADASGVAYIPNNTFLISQDTELFAVWIPSTIPVKYTVTYDANGGTGTVPVDTSSPYNSGTAVTILGANTLTKNGYTFLGWSKNKLSATADYTPNQQFHIFANTIFYAIWQQDQTNPPGTNPPGVNPPGTNPPGTNPPGTNPPGTNPPGTNPPGRERPITTTPGRDSGRTKPDTSPNTSSLPTTDGLSNLYNSTDTKPDNSKVPSALLPLTGSTLKIILPVTYIILISIGLYIIIPDKNKNY